MTIDPVATSINPLTRQQLSDFLPNPRAIKTFESLQQDAGSLTDSLNSVITEVNAISVAPVVTTEIDAAFPNAAVLTSSAEIAVDLATGQASFTLTPTGVDPGTYGDASHLVRFAIDAKGRISSSESLALVSDSVTEGATNLYFTQARARASLSDGAGIDYDDTTGVISAHPAGTYGAPTGILSRTAFAGYVSPSISNPPTQSEVQSIADALQATTRLLAALVTDMRANGNLA